MCANLPFFVLFFPAGCNLARPGYEIFSQFFHDPDVSSLPISCDVLQGERIRPSLNDFATRYTEAPSLQRTYIWMCMSQEGSFGQNRFEGQRPRRLDATRVKCTWFYMKSGIQRPNYVKPLSPIVSPGFSDILGTNFRFQGIKK